jgi:class 3 adenylate cyclase/HAMP domain-containing protein
MAGSAWDHRAGIPYSSARQHVLVLGIIMAIKSLNQRLALFLLLPVASLLFLSGFIGFFFAREVMLDEWKEASVLKLQRAAHFIDMRLSRPIEVINMFHNTGEYQGDLAIQEWLLDQLRAMDGVSRVDLEWTDTDPETMPMGGRGDPMMGRGQMTRFRRENISEVTSPRYDAEAGEETVTLISDLKNESGSTLGRLKVSVRFEHLMQDIKKLGWWQGDMACLVDTSGRYLAHTESYMGSRHHLGEMSDPFELSVLESMKEKHDGTVLGPGRPPRIVGGFCRLNRAPWVLLLFAPGEKILEPMIKFRLYYGVAGLISILFILVLIRFISGKMVRTIQEISRAAEEVAKGTYGHPLRAKTDDEVGQLITSFNKMVEGLKERDFIGNTFGRYMDQEIAKELLSRPEAIRLGGEKREVAILMSDIRNFTSLSESMNPEGTIRVINRYFSHMIEMIQKHRGIIVDFFGDSVLVFFDSLENPVESVAREAVRCGLDMQESMKRFNVEMEAEGLPEFQMGIGINVGDAVVGNIGSELRAKYGIVGPAVNITNRIQAECKGGQILVSESVYRYLNRELRVKSSFEVLLKGVKERATLFEIDGFLGNST